MKKVIIFALALAMVATGCSKVERKKNLSIEEAKTQTLEFINNNLMAQGSKAEVKEIVEDYGMYKLTVTANGQEITSYVTKDGTKFFPSVMDIEEIKSEMAEAENGSANSAPAVVEAPKADEVTAELFVMSFCPYGVMAEEAMAPVYELLGDEADIDIRYIASMPSGSDDINDVKSLHGAIEGIENARQLCVEKNYGKDVLWDYVSEINEKCYPIYRDGEDVYEECWQEAAQNAGASVAKLDTCVENEGAELIKEADSIAKSYGVSGSPTVIINGAKVQPTRTPEGFKQAICSGFNNPPAACNEVLSSEGGVAGGGC
jgi:glutaredoxin